MCGEVLGIQKKGDGGGLLSFITCKSKSAMNCLPIAYHPCLSSPLPTLPSQYSLSLSLLPSLSLRAPRSSADSHQLTLNTFVYVYMSIYTQNVSTGCVLVPIR